MKAVVVNEYGGPDVLELRDVPEPHAGPWQVRVRVHAAAVNPADTLLRVGAMDAAMSDDVPRPYRPGMDLAGILDEIGPGADAGGLEVGDRVMAMVIPTDSSGGAYAEYVVLQAKQIVRAPSNTDHVHTSTVPMNGLTAQRALDVLTLQPGAWVAVTGAAGAVGGYAVELAKAHGLNVIADASPADVELVTGFGADHVLPRGDGLAEAILRIRSGGVDAVVDTALLGSGIAPALRKDGQLTLLRHLSGLGVTAVPGRPDIVLRDVSVPDYRLATDKLDELRDRVETKRLTTRVAKVYPAERAASAHRALEAGGIRGRLVLTF